MIRARLLVVDDDPITLALLNSILGRKGYQITLAPHGGAAMARLEEDGSFDAVLLDRQMPELDGMEVLRRMKASSPLKDIPVILQTSMDKEEEIQEGLRAGALYYLVKPLDPRLVLQVVAAAIGERAERRRLWSAMEGVRSAVGLIQRGVFRFQTLHQCHDLTALLARACPNPRRSGVGLAELLINALEHGNLGITYQEKSELIEANAWDAEVIRRQELPEHRDKWVTVTLVKSPTRTRIRIQDMGPGFPWQDFQGVSPERMFDSHGRGILLAKYEAFDRIQYLGNGNCVVAEIDHG